MTPEWSDLKALIALSHCGSIAGAARQLRLDSSTLSRRLTALEQSVGARLVVRGSRELSWTNEGRAALGAAEAIADIVASLSRRCMAARLENSGTIRVSCAPALLPLLRGELLPRLRSQYPKLLLELEGTYARADLTNAEADVAVRMGNPSEPGLVARRAFELGWAVYTAKDDPAPTVRQQLEGMHGRSLVLYSRSMLNVGPLAWLERMRVEASDVIRVDNLEVAALLTADGAGLSVLPCVIGDRDVRLRRLAPEPVAFNTGFVVYHEAVRETARVRVVVDLLLEVLKRHRALLLGTSPPVRGAVSG